MKLIFNKKSNQDEALPSNLDWFLTSGEGFSDTCILPDKLTMGNKVYQYGIYHNAFYGETDINALVIPASITYIGVKAFARSSIKSLKLLSNTPPQLADSAFSQCDEDLTIYVPAGARNKYYMQNWILACGGEDNWEKMIQEGDYAIVDNNIQPLFNFGIVDDTTTTLRADINDVGLMPFLTQPSINIDSDFSVSQTQGLDYNNTSLQYNHELYRYIAPQCTIYSLASMTPYPPGSESCAITSSYTTLNNSSLPSNTNLYIRFLTPPDGILLTNDYSNFESEIEYPCERIFISYTAPNSVSDTIPLATLSQNNNWIYADTIVIPIGTQHAFYLGVGEENQSISDMGAFIKKYEHVQIMIYNNNLDIDNDNIKSNALYNNMFGQLEIKSRIIESLSFQNVIVHTLIIGPNVEYISPNAFKDAIITNISVDINNKCYQKINNNLCDMAGNIIIAITSESD